MTRLQLDYQAWRQTPQAEAVLECYRRFAKVHVSVGWACDIRRIALAPVQKALWGTDLGAPKYKVYDAFLECIRQDLIREMPELEPFVKPPVRRPGGRNARASGALLRGGG